ncbi:MAG TPA: translation initiation inhibitor [Candidatus Hydrogenedentes bacterium]|nr:translation initiation inhibitor [Candidatus Hydrogenedentota bacterium]HPG69330.1 translation initiation inhibitor [Candidatus Hydrogenedentota bacterium]
MSEVQQERTLQLPTVASLPLSTHSEHVITASSRQYASPEDLFGAAAAALHRLNAEPVSLDVFGLRRQDAESALVSALGQPDWPITWLEEGAEEASPFSGLHIWAISGASSTPIEVEGRVVGRCFGTHEAAFCRLGGVVPDNTACAKPAQAHAVFEALDTALRTAGFRFADVIRTWFYNDDILGWYKEFNDVRRDFFNRKQVFDGLVPASTGIGARNHAGAALVAGALAVRNKANNLHVVALPSPLQCPALDYGSCFSRAVEIAASEYRKVLVSGTASISLDGRTEPLGDVDGQIARTFEVVEAILESREMEWHNVTRCVVYVKDTKDIPRYDAFLARRNLESLPAIVTKSDVCRDDLLFEIEVDAAALR